jgi:hypothetical protein
MRELKQYHTARELCVGTFLAVIGIMLIGVAGSEMLDDWIRTAMYVAGFVGCLGGCLLMWKDLAAAAVFSLACPKGNFLGEFRLNGYFFGAYEREGENGSKQFRLVSSPKMEPEWEAACIRYLVNEGLIEEMWPQMSQKIKEEADWAFFG